MKSLKRPIIHLINALGEANGGSEQLTLDYYRLLRSEADVHLWSESTQDPRISDNYPIKRINPWRGKFPRGGTMIFVGVYFRIGRWVYFANRNRTVLIYNTDHPDKLAKREKRLRVFRRKLEIVSASPKLSSLLGRPDLPVLESPIELHSLSKIVRVPAQKFTVGRLSRDAGDKHHDEDADLYKMLVQNGCRIRIMGASKKLYRELAGIPDIELLPTGAFDKIDFLSSLDCFFYRTSDKLFETFGRVVFEAMAARLPVVCGSRGGYVEFLNHEVDSLIFSDTSEAFDQIMRLKCNLDMRIQIGERARESANAMFGEQLLERTRTFFIRS